MDIVNEVRELFAPEAVFQSPASWTQLVEVEKRLCNKLPGDLKKLYLAFNGFRGLGGTAHLWPLLRGESPTCSVEQLNEIYRQYTSVPAQLRDVIFYGSTTGERPLGYRLSDRKIVTYSPTAPDEVILFADSVIAAYRQDVSEWKSL